MHENGQNERSEEARTAYRWDFFLAHDRTTVGEAERLYDLLVGKSRVFLDNRCLKPGDDWARIIEQTQQSSQITVVLIPVGTNASYYEREEIARAISMARSGKGAHRLVPVFLSGEPKSPERIPYGLAAKQALYLSERLSLADAAEHLLALLEPGEGGRTRSCIRLRQILPVTESPPFESRSRFVSIGRSPNNSLCVPTRTVSWEHAHIALVHGQYQLRQVGRSNPSIVRRKGREHVICADSPEGFPLRNADRLTIGDTTFLVELDVMAEDGGYVTTEKKPQRTPPPVTAERTSLLAFPWVQATRDPDLHLGDRLFGKYEIFDVRTGGMGIVYMVTDPQAGTKYAVKTYKPELVGVLPAAEQFEKEIEIWLKLGPHPNIVKAYFVEIYHKQPFLFLEYVHSGVFANLREWLRAGGINAQVAISFAYDVCLGLEYANQQTELAHLDLKPANLLTSERPVVKVTDFGLAHYVRVVEGHYPRQLFGSWIYAPPERFAGEVEDLRSDVYAFGVILHELLTGELPYPFPLNGNAETCFRTLEEFHANGGMNQVSERLYYKRIPGVEGIGASVILSGCLTHFQSERVNSFTVIRELLEEHFQLRTPEHNPDSTLSVAELREHALSLSRIGHHTEARDLLNSLLRDNPQDGRLWLDAARVLLAAGDPSCARSFLEHAVKLEPALKSEAEVLLRED